VGPSFASKISNKSSICGVRVFTTGIGAVLNSNRLTMGFFKKHFLHGSSNKLFEQIFCFQFFSFCMMLQIVSFMRFFNLFTTFFLNFFANNK
jgi:hypothetical protein